MEIKSALIIMQTVVDHYSMDAAQREAWNTIRAILEEGQKPSTNNARDEICADCDGSGLETRIETTGSKCGSCGGSGRKLSSVA